jgi:hypothetical protein
MPMDMRVRLPLMPLADLFQPENECSESEEGELHQSPKKQRRKTKAKAGRADDSTKAAVPEPAGQVNQRPRATATVISALVCS